MSNPRHFLMEASFTASSDKEALEIMESVQKFISVGLAVNTPKKYFIRRYGRGLEKDVYIFKDDGSEEISSLEIEY